jgi:hypothetical protein
MVEITYNWLHIPTGKTGTHTRQFVSRPVFLEELNRWNASRSPNERTWKYWLPATSVVRPI